MGMSRSAKRSRADDFEGDRTDGEESIGTTYGR